MSLLTPGSNIFNLAIEEHMRTSYRDYAMSVITDRALPDVRDGLKPVHRRILFAMSQLGLTQAKAHMKSARVVGDVIGKYHPHGDASVYMAAVRMAQSWSLLHPLIDPHGNFGSLDDDPPAAMRYTEMRMTRLTETFFDALNKNVVDMRPNYDGSEHEPTILPILWPQILTNGTGGIAVGMAASVPPHNLGEVISAYLAFIANHQITTAEIIALMPAPDFPTGGLVHSLDGYAEAIETGRGKVKVRATWHEEPGKRGATTMVIDSIPYQVTKSVLMERMSQALDNKQVEDVDKIHDESNAKFPVKIVAYLKPGASAEVAFNQFLAACEGVEIAVHYNTNLLINGQPRVMGFREIFEHCLTFSLECIRRETEFDLAKALARLHILEGLMAAIGKLDETIALIRAAADAAEARAGLMRLLNLDIEQAQAILDLRLQKLTGLELEGLTGETNALVLAVADLRDILAREPRRVAIVVERVSAIATKFTHERKTEVSESLSTMAREDLIEREDVVIIATKGGYIKRIPVSAMNRQNRGTRGKSWMTTGDNDFITSLHPASTHDYLMCLTRSGKLLTKKAFYIPEGAAGTKGRHLRNVFDGLEEDIVNLMSVADFSEDHYLVTVSADGSIKRTPLSEYKNSVNKGGLIAVKIDEGDSIVGVDVCQDNDHIMLVASSGKAIRFVVNAEQMRPMGRGTVGTRGMILGNGEKIVGMIVIRGDGKPQSKRMVERVTVVNDVETTTMVEELDTDTMDDGNYLLCIGEKGVGKCTRMSEFGAQRRSGKGVACFNINNKTGALIQAMGVRDEQDIVMVSSAGVSVRIHVQDIRTTGRIASGTYLMNLDKTDRLVDVAKVVRAEPEEEEVSE